MNGPDGEDVVVKKVPDRILRDEEIESSRRESGELKHQKSMH
jgi:hypothetical protein